MFREIFRFEFRYHLRQPLFYVLTIVFFFLTFSAVTSEAVRIGGAIGNVNRNAPFVIMQLLLVMSTFGVLTSTAFAASSVHRDFELGTDSLFFSTPVKKWQYLGGRFFGSFAVGSLVYLGVILAIMLGSVMPWVDKDHIGPFSLVPYAFAFFVIIIPNLFLSAAIFFAVAALTRSILATYAGVVGFYVAYAIAGSYLGDLENEKLASLFDPFGFGSFELATRFWTVFERNSRVLPLEGVFLWNRLLWVGTAVVVLAFAWWRFEMKTGVRSSRKKKRIANDATPVINASLPLPLVSQTFGRTASFKQFIHGVRVETVTVMKSIPFIIMLVFGVLNTIGAAINRDELFGAPVYPVTHLMIDVIRGGFLGFTVLIATFFAGDMVWRERTLKMHEVHDATPVPGWVIWASKLVALAFIVTATLAASVMTTVGVQLAKGFHHLEPGLYLRSVFLVLLVPMILLTILAFTAQVVTGNRYVGFLVILVHLILAQALPALDFEHHLYRLFTRPGAPYSDMNGYGHFVRPLFWFSVYWLFFAGILLLAAHLLWQRGTETAFKRRFQAARLRFGRPAAVTLALMLIGFIGTGCYIFYNTNVLNRYQTTKAIEKESAEFEKKYKRYERLPQPRITAVQADVDIDPAARSLDVKGTYTIVNRTAQPIRDIHVAINPQLTTSSVMLAGSSVVSQDRTLGYTIYRLAQPLAPGATMPMTFATTVRHRGFGNESTSNGIVENGSFINNFEYFPHIGYAGLFELQEQSKRKKYGLPPIQRLPRREDAWGKSNNEISRESDWISLDTTVSTAPDQIALAPGYLQRQWFANGRRYFHYRTTSPILGFWSYLSARYEVKRDRWKDVAIEIYYDRKHPYNVDRMITAVKKSLDYYSANLSPYQHRQVRILEFPRYARFAQSFPNTIPFSESIGFIADLRNPDKIDYVFYVTAHEVAHQWWAHQVIGANVQGSTMITETLAQYSALMVMEKEYGREQMRKFLKYELNRYLSGRGGERIAEMPLELVEGQQYIHYAKGSLAMYALRDAIGEANVNRALASFIRRWGFRGPDYATTIHLLDEFRAVTPPEQQSLITDLFQTITLYDNKTTDVSSSKLPDGRYKVTVKVESTKLRGDGAGNEKPVALSDFIDIGVFGVSKAKDSTAFGKSLVLERRKLTTKSNTFEFITPEKPARAGIDPLNKLIDRNPDDNTKKLD